MYTFRIAREQVAIHCLALGLFILALLIFGVTVADNSTEALKNASSKSEAASTGRLGRLLSKAEIDALDSHVFSNGAQLPEGKGGIKMGRDLYQRQCMSCHGGAGEGASALELVGDRGLLATQYPDKGIGVYWPYAPTLFQYIKRAMPPDKPGLFTNDELYSIVAYLLYLNDLLPEGSTLDRDSLAKIELPNRNGFANQFTITNMAKKL